MKKKLFLGSLVLFLFSAAIIIFQISCSQQAPAQTSTTNCIGAQPKFQFKANGTLYVCDAVFDNRFGWKGNYFPDEQGELPNLRFNSSSTNPHYELCGGMSTSTTNKSGINLFLQTTSLPSENIVYNYNNVTSDCGFSFSNSAYTMSSFIVTFNNINRNNSGVASGIFSGTVWPTSTPSQIVTITDGLFSNIPIFNY